MSEHNFYDSLRDFAATDPLRLCMPGHKGKRLPMPEWDALAALDFTELGPTGDLYGPGDDWLEEAQRLWAWDWGMNAAFFATGGSTQGIFTLLALFTRPGDTVLVDRVSHRSIHNALALFDLRPVWLERPWVQNRALTGPVEQQTLARALEEHPEATAVLLTDPTYYGVRSELDDLARLCHAAGKKLLVDGAHGAHLPLVLPGEQNCLLGRNPYQNCDGVTVSTHKTLPAPGQTAVVLVNGKSMKQLRAASALTATTSPSFPMLAGLDCLRPWLHENKNAYRETSRRCAEMRGGYPCLTLPGLDPCRVTLQVEDGHQTAQALEARGIYAEMADRDHVVFICTAADTEADFARLRSALDALGLGKRPPAISDLPAPPAPEPVLSPRQARFSTAESLPLAAAEGKIAAQWLAPYPPGVPVIAPGERVTKKILDYLYKLCYSSNSAILVCKE